MTIDPVSLAITVAINAALMAVTMSQKIEGPRSADLNATVADYGTPLNNFYGRRRFEVPAFYAEGIREVKKKRKTKGGKYNEYVYYGTWAVAIAEHEIDAVLRVWFDRHLVYDVSTTGPRDATSVLADTFEEKANDTGQLSAQYYRLYYGTEDQLPDPRIEQKIDAEEGAGSTPAYRGLAYIMFEDVPLEKFGNRFPQVSVEAIREAEPSFPFETYTSTALTDRLWNFSYSTDFSRVVFGTGNFEIWDLATRTLISSGTWPADIDLHNKLGVSKDGLIWAIGTADGLQGALIKFSADGKRVVSVTDLLDGDIQNSQTEVRVVMDGWGREHYGTIPFSIYRNYYFDGALKNFETQFGIAARPMHYFADGYGEVWAAFVPIGDLDTVYFQRQASINARPGSPGLVIVHGLTPIVGGSPLHGITACHYKDDDVDQFVFIVDGFYMYAADIESGNINAAISANFGIFQNAKQMANVVPGAKSIYLGPAPTEYSLKDLSVIRTINTLDWLFVDSNDVYDPVNHALIGGQQFGGSITWRFLDRPAGVDVLLSDIIEDVCAKVGLDATEFDAAALTQTIPGYSWSMSPAADIAGALLELYDSDVRPHDAKIQFIRRDTSPSITLLRENLARRSNDEPVVKSTLISDVDLPFRIFFNFADIDADQTPNTAVAQRGSESVDSNNELPIDMSTLALTVDAADALAKRALRVRWFERTMHDLALTPMNLAFEPGDVVNLPVAGDAFSARLIKMNIQADGLIETKWVNTDPAVHDLLDGNGAALSGRAASVILVPGLSEGFVIDGPLCNDADDQASPFVYVAAAPYDSSAFYPGTEIARSEAGDEFDAYDLAWEGIGATEAVTFAVIETALPDSVPFVFDRGSVLTAEFRNGTPVSYTEDEILENDSLNLVAVGSHETGWEYLQFATATLVSGTTYELTDLLRGRRGSEQFMSTHIDGERLVFVSPSTRVRSVGISDLGETLFYRPVTQGRTLQSAVPVSYVYAAVTHKPYAPVHLELSRDVGTGDWSIEWVRRTRLGGNLIDGQDVPLGESSESYKIEILDYDEVVATKTATAENYTYTAAEQNTDFGALQLNLSVRVRQVSPALNLDGYFTEATA